MSDEVEKKWTVLYQPFARLVMTGMFIGTEASMLRHVETLAGIDKLSQLIRESGVLEWKKRFQGHYRMYPFIKVEEFKDEVVT